MRRRIRAGTAALAALIVAGAAGCGSALVGTAAAAEITTVGTCEALLDRLHEIGRTHVGPFGLDGTGPVIDDIADAPRPAAIPDAVPRVVAEDRVGAGAAPGSAPSAPATTTAPEPAASGTNVQEAGVDEDDTVKAGPGRILVLDEGDAGDVLRYVDVTAGPPRTRGVATFGFETEGMLVEGNRVVVIGSDTAAGSGSGNGRVILAEVDITDPDHLVKGAQVRIDGRLRAARSRGASARIVVDSVPDIGFVAPGRGADPEDRAAAANRRIVDATAVEDWLPKVDGRPGVDCDAVMVPRDYAGAGMLTVYSVDMAAPLRIADAAALMARGEVAYASESALYVAMDDGGRSWSGADAAIEQTTRIHAFDISGPAAAEYRASGEVPGAVKDRWTMSEAAGVLRVVTTAVGADGREVTRLTTLMPRGSDLAVTGQVDGLGRGEQVKAVRFAGDVGYVVTFKRTDPLWVLDLRDPAAPKVAGELHMPGYSTYLHPIGGGRLIGVGQDADPATGRPLGMQVALYDVTDAARPVVAAKWQAPAGTTSLAEDDAHAFLWWEPTGTVALPIRSATTMRPVPPETTRPVPVPPEQVPDSGRYAPSSAVALPTEATLVLRAGSAGLAEAGRITCPAPERPEATYAGDLRTAGSPRRNVVVGSNIYTVCDSGVTAHGLDELTVTGETRWG